MQHEITSRGPLLDEKGHLREAGFAKSLILDYDRTAIKAGKLRIKEWDYYLISDGRRALALTIADNSYMGMGSVSYLKLSDLEGGQSASGFTPSEKTKSEMTVMPLGKTKLPATSERGNVHFETDKVKLSFENDGSVRTLSVAYKGWEDGKTLKATVRLKEAPAESMVIATPYKEDPKAFYYNQKINCLRAEGVVRLGEKEYRFKPDTAFAVLDWGRGVWTYSNTWYWSSASGAVDGHRFGFNLGYGFGDTSAASENMLFYDGKAHKLEDVTFEIPKSADGKDDFMSPWKFTSSDGRFEADFVPVLDRASDTNVGVIQSDQHQVFGLFSGRAVLDDGTVITMENFAGFAEKVKNRW